MGVNLKICCPLVPCPQSVLFEIWAVYNFLTVLHILPTCLWRFLLSASQVIDDDLFSTTKTIWEREINV